MEGAGILDGDLVIVRPQNSAKNGDIDAADMAGKIEMVSYDEQSHIFAAQVLPNSSQQAEVQIRAR